MALALAFAGVVALFSVLEGQRWAAAAKGPAETTQEQPARSDPGVEPWKEKDITSPQTTSSRSGANQDRQTLPLDEDGYPLPTREQIQVANQPRSYKLPPGAIMSLSVPAIDLRHVPVLESTTEGALDQGVVHLPDTSMPWSDTPERNVYLAGHRLGWPDTGSHLIFYRLDELDGGERITLRGPEGNTYNYRVIDTFNVRPDENWVTGRVRDRDLLTLQTCTPIPSFELRLIVRAERV